MLVLTTPIVIFAGIGIMMGGLLAGMYPAIDEPAEHPVVEVLFHPVTLLVGLPAVYVVGYVIRIQRTGRVGRGPGESSRRGT